MNPIVIRNTVQSHSVAKRKRKRQSKTPCGIVVQKGTRGVKEDRLNWLGVSAKEVGHNTKRQILVHAYPTMAGMKKQ